MGQIGNYIHGHYQNYLKHGITKSNNGNSWNVTDFKAQHKNFLNNIKPASNPVLTDAEKKNLRKSIYAISNSTDNSQDNSKAIQEFIASRLQEQFDSTLGNINFDTMNVTANKIQQSKNKTYKLNDTQYIQLPVLLERIKTIEKLMGTIESPSDKIAINNTIKQIYQNIKQLTGIFIKDLRINNLEAGQRIFRIGEGYEKNKEMVISINETLNQLIKDYLATPAINLQKGELFEYAIALAPAIALQKGTKELNKELQNFAKTKVGGNRSRVQIDLDKNFNEEIGRALANASIPGYMLNSDNNTILSYGVSQDKIDINLSWGGKTIPVSAKNIKLNSSYNIHILSGSSLLYLLQNENSDFVNHYLNVTSSHKDSEADLSLFYAAHEAAKIAILAKALTGNLENRKSATTFIINDNSKTGEESIQIYDMYDLVKKAITNIDSYVKITGNEKDLSSIHFNNKLVDMQKLSSDAAINRIANLLLNIHSYKMNVQLKKNILK